MDDNGQSTAKLSGGFSLLGPRPIALPRPVLEAAAAAFFIVLATILRGAIERFVPGVSVFLLVPPAVAGATLLAGGRAGLIVLAGCQLLAWYYLLPYKNSFAIASNGDALSLLLSTVAELLLLWSLTRYRDAASNAAKLRDQRNVELERNLEKQSALDNTRKNLEAIYQASGDGLALCEAIFDTDGHVVEYQVLEVNKAHAELTGATREQMLTRRVSTIAPPIDPRWFETAEKVLKTGITHNFDVRSRATGRWLNIRVSRVSDRLFQQTFVDVSDRHMLEEQRTALMKEMNHRVLNNFQMISGFLQLQASAAHPAAKSQMQTAGRRIQVLARLHSFLAYTESEHHIDAAAYIRELCGYLDSLIDRPEAMRLVCETDELRLPAQTVVALGFVVSELVANSAKYAYPEPAAGDIRIKLSRQAQAWSLVIADDGKGFENGQSPAGGGLGMKLVRNFVEQIGAKLVTTSNGGVHHEITADF